MTAHLDAICFAARRPPLLARFWSELLGREPADDVTLAPAGDAGFAIRFVATEEPKAGQNRAHFDLTSSSLEDQQRIVERALALGARHVDVGQRPEEGHVVLADPEGDEFCVIEPGNRFLAGCGAIGALACDGTQEVGYFRAAALEWPLVWDQDEETAIQSPRGGTKITWGGPPLMPRIGGDRVWLDLSLGAGDEPRAEVERLVSLGATCADVDPGETGFLELADPDGNRFRLLSTR
jgi:catechol 2,3-dioxygenase-like lactoylglutathione lyase family enzyme